MSIGSISSATVPTVADAAGAAAEAPARAADPAAAAADPPPAAEEPVRSPWATLGTIVDVYL